ncbi:sigma-70 family RNA polymerase sigma factor [Nocardioides sp.]|uniref:sigma-70 family RNA polymerase sigma factor n=1 Tax=Nocardioides sp. TaxID=35761 RepID=UPI0039E31835
MTDPTPGALPDLGALLDEPGDAELISAVRGGDLDAYGELFTRHVDAARRLARQLVSAGDVDDLVSEAFAKVLSVLQRGGGPDLAFRAYLLTSVRRLHVDKLRGSARLQTTDDLTPYDPGVPFEDTAVAGFENETAARAFASLPERWQQVLWHTEVEGQKPAEVAMLLGMSANSVSALAYRAREGLREAFISMHAQDAVEDACATTRARLGAYIRGGISKRDSAKVEDHLQECRPCSAIYLELTEVNSDLGALLAPLLLGSAGAGYLAASGVAAKVGFLAVLDRGKDWVLHNPAGRATGGVAAAAVLAVAVAGGLQAFSGDARPEAAPATGASASVASPPAQPSTQPPAEPPASTGTTPDVEPSRTTPVTPVIAPSTSLPTSTTTTAASQSAERAPIIRKPLGTVTLPAGSDAITIDLTKGAVDPDGGQLTVRSARIKGAVKHGTVTVVGANRSAREVAVGRRTARDSIVYTPQPSWRGTETIVYVLADVGGDTVRGTVDVATPNRPPVAGADSVKVHLARTATGPWTSVDVLANDADPNGDPLTPTITRAPQHGEARIDGGLLRYRPVVGYAGTDSLDYQVDDGHGGTATATLSVEIGLFPNLAPVATSPAVTTGFQESLTLHLADLGSDPDNDDLTLAIGTQPGHGTVVRNGDTLTYTPQASYDGPDSFTYTLSDGADTTTGTVHVTVEPNHAPLADPDQATTGTTGDRSVTVDVLANDTDPDGDPLTLVSVTGAAHGTATVVNGKVHYEPDPAFDGVETLDYVVADGFGAQTTGTLTVDVQTPESALSITNEHTPPANAYLASEFVVHGIPQGRHAHVEVVIEGFSSWGPYHLIELSGCGGWSVSGSTYTLECDLDAAANGVEISHIDVYADSLTATVTATDFVDTTTGDDTSVGILP